jgi:hypothetical protein
VGLRKPRTTGIITIGIMVVIPSTTTELAGRGEATTRRQLVEPTMHKFDIGQTVFLVPVPGLKIAGGAYIITRRLPERDGQFVYQVKSTPSHTSASWKKVN